jgi:hypothetical protein
MRIVSLAILGLTALWASSASAKKSSAPLEVTAKLVKIPSTFPPDDLYDYAYVMQYQVVSGPLASQLILVAHYKPRQDRQKIVDKMKKNVQGTLKRFEVGALHKMILTAELRRVWKGALVDEFFAKDRQSVRYFCLKVDPAPTK